MATACILVMAIAGCAEEGVGENATATVYATASRCEGARGALVQSGGRAGEVEVRLVCLGTVEAGGRADLARIGANARRATEDASAVAYLAAPDRVAGRFSRPILEAAGIARLSAPGGVAMARVLTALRDADESAGLRGSVLEQVG